MKFIIETYFFSKRAGHAKAQRHSEHYARFRFMVCTEVFAFAVLETPKSAKINFTKEGKT
tara:strand:- start:190 stop:369 length:180 start_codon:yes stop_codon:yes gene_type:complete